MSLEVSRNFSFASNTTYGCGGMAESAYFPESEKEIIDLYDKLSCDRFFILGNGSNVLACDGIYNGSVISTKKVNGIRLLAEDLIYCECGVTVPQLLKLCREKGISGLEFLSGIPATVGGLCYMNAGVAGEYIDGVVDSVIFYDGERHNFSNKKCNFTYKHSIMCDINCIILGCFFKTYRSTPQKVTNLCNYYKSKRNHLPKGKSCGCVFKNPEGKSAGVIIESAGLKGYSIGNAKVSDKHANFIINGGTCSQNVYDLISYVKRTVYQKFSTELEEEVCYIGDFK